MTTLVVWCSSSSSTSGPQNEVQVQTSRCCMDKGLGAAADFGASWDLVLQCLHSTGMVWWMYRSGLLYLAVASCVIIWERWASGILGLAWALVIV
jgi:hypothetical protein